MIDKPPEMPGQLTLEPPTCHVVLPYTHGREDVQAVAAVMGWGGSYTCQQLSGVLDYAYPEAMAEWWETGLDTVIVNQQAEVRGGIIRELLACPRPWCVRARIVPGVGARWNLDLVKVSAQLMAEHPHLIRHMLDHHVEQGNTLEWDEWDSELSYLLTVLGKTVHVHHPRNLGTALSSTAAGGG